jgi:hypothetical protein
MPSLSASSRGAGCTNVVPSLKKSTGKRDIPSGIESTSSRVGASVSRSIHWYGT